MSGTGYVYVNGNGGGNRRRSSHNGNGVVGNGSGSLESVYQPVNQFNGVEIQNILHNNFERYRSRAAVYEEIVRKGTVDGREGDSAGTGQTGGEEHEFTMVSSSSNSYGGYGNGYGNNYGRSKGKDLLSELSKSMMHMHTHKNSNGMNGTSSGSGNNSHHHHHHYHHSQQQ